VRPVDRQACIQKYLLISEYDFGIFPLMKHCRTKAPKTERINLCLTRDDREALENIAQREDRDLGYLAAWFVEWGIEHYQKLGISLVELSSVKVVREKLVRRRAAERLVLREEARRLHEETSESSPKRQQA
jgi:hypothetical protein